MTYRGGTDISPLVAVCVTLLFVTLIALLVPRVIFVLRLRRRAEQDYQMARGTQHLRQLKACLGALKRDLGATKNQVTRLEQALRQLKDEHSGELRTALCRHLVTERLTEVHGIGPRLQERILSQCFRGDLADLRRADKLFNIGPARQAALKGWARARERELPRLLEDAFPGKERIVKRYRTEITSLEKQLDRALKKLTNERAILAAAEKAVDELNPVRLSNFRKALMDREPNIYVPGWYLTGVYAPWESPPRWFVTLLDRHGG